MWVNAQTGATTHDDAMAPARDVLTGFRQRWSEVQSLGCFVQIPVTLQLHPEGRIVAEKMS